MSAEPRPLGAGAQASAPTAPHATPPAAGEGRARASGPARFWDPVRLRIAFAVTFVLSLVVHGVVSPFTLIPNSGGVELKDVDDELGIPVDLLGGEVDDPEPKAPEPAPSVDPANPTAPGPGKAADGGAPDAAPHDAGPKDAAGASDAAVRADGAAGDAAVGVEVASGDAGDGDAGALAAGDAGVGGAGPRDPAGMIGLASLSSAGVVNVTLLVNTAVIREHPVGARLGPIFKGLPQWSEFLRGGKIDVDPVRDVDWVLVYGPSLIHTDRAAMLVRYSAPDEVVDRAVGAIAERYEHGGPFDAGVPGVKASVGFADNGKRVFLRAQPKLLVVVPPDKAHEFAVALRRSKVSPKVRPGEAMRLVVKDPWRQVAIPRLKLSQNLKELRVWIVPRASDGGADVYGEADATDAASAAEAAEALTELIRQQNANFGVKIVTKGLLNGVRVTAEGNKAVLHVSASREQIEALAALLAATLGVELAPPR